MDASRFLTLIGEDGALLGATARRADLEAPIPTCPGWTIRRCVAHVAEVYQQKLACIRLERRPQDDDYVHSPPAGTELMDWYDASLAALVAELAERGPAASAYTWWPPDQTVGFWFRRMAQETAVHRVDVQDALGSATPVDVELALDGIDELLEVFMVEDWDSVTADEWGDVDRHAGEGEVIAVRSGGGVWRSTLGPERIALDREDGPSDATVSGDPESVLLWLWGRRPDDIVHITGNAETVIAFRDRLRIATQ